MEMYEMVHRLGSGGCGAVYLVRHKETRKLFAQKKIDLDERKKNRTKEAVQKEAKILSHLKHPHIVAYQDSFFDMDEDCLFIIQDYCDGGNLDDRIKDAARNDKHFDEEQIMNWFTQLIMAVQYIHSKKVLHRDLKAENVFLTKKNVVKIGDFGISKMLESTIDVAKTVVGTPSYLSPELCQDIPYSSKSDIWACGCLLYEMCALKPPFDAQSLISLFFKIIKAEFDPIPDRYSPELHDLVNTILVKAPDDRPSASALLNTVLVKKHLAKFIEEKEHLLQQKGAKEEGSPGSHNLSAKSKGTPKSGSNSLNVSPMITKKKVPSRDRSPLQQDSGLGVAYPDSTVSNTQVLQERLKANDATDAASDYSDDFDESQSEDEIPEDLPAQRDSDIEEDIPDGSEYADDFEEYDSSEDLDILVNQAREAQDIQAQDDYFVDDFVNDVLVQQSVMLRQQCKQVIGGKKLGEVKKLTEIGTITEEDLELCVKHSVAEGEDASEICHFDISDLHS